MSFFAVLCGSGKSETLDQSRSKSTQPVGDTTPRSQASSSPSPATSMTKQHEIKASVITQKPPTNGNNSNSSKPDTKSVTSHGSSNQGSTTRSVHIDIIKDTDSDFDDSIHNNRLVGSGKFKPVESPPSTKGANGTRPSKQSQNVLSSIRSDDTDTSGTNYRQYNSLNSIKIEWSELEIRTNNPKEAIIGHGSFGTVIRAYWKPKGGIAKLMEKNLISSVDTAKNDEIVVAVKVFTRSLVGASDYNPTKLYQQACEEVALIRQAGERMLDSSRIIHAYGATKGPLTPEMCRVFRIQEGEDGVGVIMRCVSYSVYNVYHVYTLYMTSLKP